MTKDKGRIEGKVVISMDELEMNTDEQIIKVIDLKLEDAKTSIIEKLQEIGRLR